MNIFSGYCMKNNSSSPNFYIFFLLSLLIGIILRLYILTDQILLDDEWHSIDYVPDKSLYYLLTHMGTSANSIPMNIYRHMLLHTVGWSEFLLRIPSLFFGILSLMVFPFLVKKITGTRAAIIFSFLLAISPLLIFYSRVSRAYGAVSFLVFFSLISLYLWLISGRTRWAVSYVLSGALSVYFHLFALVGVISPFGFVFLYQISPETRKNENMLFPKPGHLAGVLLSLVILTGILLLPALLQSSFPLVPTEDRASFHSFAGVIPLICGTANPFFIVIFMSMAIGGFTLLWKRSILLSGMFFFVVLFYFLAIKSVKHSGIHISLEIARFSICVFPISYMLAATGIDRFLSFIDRIKYGNMLTAGLAGLFFAGLFLKGPLPVIYGSVNNFTNHTAFQESYKPKDQERSYENQIASEYYIKRKDIPSFYFRLAIQEDAEKIIEYPMYIGNHYNFFIFTSSSIKKR